jgi:hypothetical protein
MSSVPAARVGPGWLALERVANAGSMAGLILMERSNISLKKTPGAIGKYLDPILAKLSASSLLSLPMWVTSHPSKLRSSLSYIARYAIMFAQVASHSFMTCWAMRFESPWILMRVAPQAFAKRMSCRTTSYSASLFEGFTKRIRRT